MSDEEDRRYATRRECDRMREHTHEEIDRLIDAVDGPVIGVGLDGSPARDADEGIRKKVDRLIAGVAKLDAKVDELLELRRDPPSRINWTKLGTVLGSGALVVWGFLTRVWGLFG